MSFSKPRFDRARTCSTTGARTGRCARRQRFDVAAYDHLYEFGHRRFGHLASRDIFAVAKHRHAVAEIEDFLHAVRHIDDADTLVAQPAYHRQQQFRFAAGERRGRLVEDHDSGAGGDDAGDGNNLPLGDGQPPDDCGGIERDAEFIEDASRFDMHPAAIDQADAVCGLATEIDVFCDAQIGFQVQFLMHRTDAQQMRFHRACNRNRLAVENDLAAVGWLHSAEDLDQRRFACAILAHQRMHLAGDEIETDVAERLDSRKYL